MIKRLLLVLISLFLLVGCGDFLPKSNVKITIIDSGNQTEFSVSADSTVATALNAANFSLGPLDRVDPSLQTMISDNLSIRIFRVKEDFYIEESTLSFEHQTVKNESLPEGQTILIQAGTNGTQQTIYRILSEDGKEISRSFVSSEVQIPSKPEIVMIGVQSPYSIQSIDGIIAYISNSNAWIIEYWNSSSCGHDRRSGWTNFRNLARSSMVIVFTLCWN
jgi:uncharacterized protein YabE (DUF348 family)